MSLPNQDEVVPQSEDTNLFDVNLEEQAISFSDRESSNSVPWLVNSNITTLGLFSNDTAACHTSTTLSQDWLGLEGTGNLNLLYSQNSGDTILSGTEYEYSALQFLPDLFQDPCTSYSTNQQIESSFMTSQEFQLNSQQLDTHISPSPWPSFNSETLIAGRSIQPDQFNTLLQPSISPIIDDQPSVGPAVCAKPPQPFEYVFELASHQAQNHSPSAGTRRRTQHQLAPTPIQLGQSKRKRAKNGTVCVRCKLFREKVRYLIRT